MEQNKEVEKPTTEHLASEIIAEEKAKSKAKDRGIIAIGIALIVITLGMAILNYRNNCDWRELFASYDYVSQNGEGINYYNSDVGGNVNNGAENKETKK